MTSTKIQFDRRLAESQLLHLLRSNDDARRGRLKITPEVLSLFPRQDEEPIREFLAEKGILGSTAQLAVLIPRYLKANPGALAKPSAIDALRTWLRRENCKAQTIQLLRQLRHMGYRFGAEALPGDVVQAVRKLFNENPDLLHRPVCYQGPGGLISFARVNGIKADRNTLIAVFDLFPLTIATGAAVARNRLDVARSDPRTLAEKFVSLHSEGSVNLTGPAGFIAFMAHRGVAVHGHDAERMLLTLGCTVNPPTKADSGQIKHLIINVISSDLRRTAPYQITGVNGLHIKILQQGCDCSPDAVRRIYTAIGGNLRPSVVKRAEYYSQKLPEVLHRLLSEQPEYFANPVAIRGRGGLKEKVWGMGVRANHEVIRRYAVQVGIALQKVPSAPQKVA